MSETTKKNLSLKQGAVVLVLSSIIVKLIGAFFKIPLSSDLFLGDLGFGYFSSAHDIFMPIYFIAISGFPVVISRTVAQYAAEKRYADVKETLLVSRKLILLIAVIMLVLYLALIFPLVSITDKTGDSIYSFLAVAPSIIFCFWSSCYRGYFEGLEDMKPAAVSGVIEALGKLILGLGLSFAVIKLTANPALAAAAAVTGISIGTLASALYLRFRYKFNNGLKDFDKIKKSDQGKIIAKNLLIIAFPILFASLSNSLVALVDAITVRYQLSNLIVENKDLVITLFSKLIAEYSNSTGELISNDALPTLLYGIRGKAFTLFNLIPTLTVSIGVSLIPTVTASFAKKDYSALKENINSVLKMSALICFPAGLGYFVFGERIMALLFGVGESSVLGGRMLMIYGIAAIFAGFSLPLAGILQAMGKQNLVLINVVIGLSLKIVFNLILCSNKSVNILGAAYSTLICFAVTCVLHIIVLYLKTSGKVNLVVAVWKPAISALICIILARLFAVLGNSSLITLLSILIAMVSYLVFLIIFNTFDETDISALPAGKSLTKVCYRLKILR